MKFKLRINKIMKIIELYERIMKSINNLQFHMIITNIRKKMKLHATNMKIMKILKLN